MRFLETELSGAFVIEVEPRFDERGLFARTFCADAFAAHGLASDFVQCSTSWNARAGTLRGMHWQDPPHAEVKLVRCIKGAIYDVVVDMREESDTYLRWFGAELSEDSGITMYVPKGFAHGYQTLTDGATAFYMVSAYYAPEFERGLRFDDPKLAIRWPRTVSELSDKDAKWPLL